MKATRVDPNRKRRAKLDLIRAEPRTKALSRAGLKLLSQIAQKTDRASNL
jgi:hypothetical protein